VASVPRKIIVTASVTLALAATACTGDAPADTLSVGSAADLYPSQRIADWVSYADHVVYFTVMGERELPWGEHEKTHGEGMVDREVTLRIDRVLWSGKGAPAPELPDEFSMVTWGWTLKENKRTPFAAHGGPRLEAGSSYLAALIHSTDYGWEPQTNSTVLPVDESGLAQRDRLHGDSRFNEAINTFVGKSPEEILTILESAQPDPVAARYLHLRPVQRYKMVVLETEMPDRPGFLKAANVEGDIYTHGSTGYVREEDWAALVATGDKTATIPLFDRDGAAIDDVGIALDDLVLGPGGLTTDR
jgi:hypothetical protein